MKRNIKTLALVLTMLTLLSVLAACTGKKLPPDTGSPNTGSDDAMATPSDDKAQSDAYTYRLALSYSPTNWSPMDWQTIEDARIMQYLVGSPVELSIDEDGNYDWTFEMFANMTDVSASWEEAKNWIEPNSDGIYPQDGEGYIYRIDLNTAAKWQDGTPVTADDYIWSMRHCIDASINNYRGGPEWPLIALIKNARAYRDDLELDNPGTSWDDVGFIKGDDYTIYLVPTIPTPINELLYNLTESWLVKPDLYEASQSGYGSSIDKFSSTGPYIMTAFVEGEYIELERNENWYGWTDGKHEGQYQTTKIRYEIIEDHAKQLELFNKGLLDQITLEGEELETYGKSDRLIIEESAEVYQYAIVTDLDKLIELEGSSGANKRILAYKEFRQALSLCINRQELCDECIPLNKPALSLLNDQYYCDAYDTTFYRNTDYAKESILRVYGVEYGEGKAYSSLDEAYKSITGYDKERATELFRSAIEKAIADKNYTPGQDIVIDCAASIHPLNDVLLAEQDLVNRYIAEAIEGIEDIGKVTINYIGDCDELSRGTFTGRIEMARYFMSGSAFRPHNVIKDFCDPDRASSYIPFGFHPNAEKIEIPLNGESTIKTFKELLFTLADAGDVDSRVFVLSYLESGLLQNAHIIPIASAGGFVTMYSNKIQYDSTELGDFRHMTYNYDDAEWVYYVAQQGGTIDYR